MISKITPAGEKSGFAVDRASFVGLTFSTLGNLFATLQDSLSGQQSIFSYAPDGTRHLFHLSRGPGMAFDNAGNFYVTSGDFKKILKYTPAGGRAYLPRPSTTRFPCRSMTKVIFSSPVLTAARF